MIWPDSSIPIYSHFIPLSSILFSVEPATHEGMDNNTDVSVISVCSLLFFAFMILRFSFFRLCFHFIFFRYKVLTLAWRSFRETNVLKVIGRNWNTKPLTETKFRQEN